MQKTYWKLHTQPRVIKEDDCYILEENQNYPPGTGNIFLMRFSESRSVTKCIGGVENKLGRGVWVAQVSWYDEDDPDTDCREIYRGDRETAIEKLWQERFNAL